ncbi:MAG: ABC transporter substrate-binding protein [Clostridiaceae bacterium]|nr:ABC transporter substrate-binding protein [Clostridiaceae bacterium]
MKKILTLFVASMVVVSMSACSSVKEKESDTSKPKMQILNIGAINSVDVVPIVIADQKGYFKKQGLEVRFQPFKSPSDRDAALQAGSLDGLITDEIGICLYENGGLDVRITGITDGNFILVAGADSGIKEVKDVKGKSVAISEKTSIEYTLDKILEKNSMSPKDVKKTVVPAIPTRFEMLRNKKVDLALLPEPFATLAIKEGGIAIASASKLGTYPSVTAFTQKSIDNKSNEIKAFYKAYNETVNYINSTPISEYEDTVIKTVGYPEEMKGKIILPKFRQNILPTEEGLKAVIDWTTNKGLVKKVLNPKDLINSIGVN